MSIRALFTVIEKGEGHPQKRPEAVEDEGPDRPCGESFGEAEQEQPPPAGGIEEEPERGLFPPGPVFGEIEHQDEEHIPPLPLGEVKDLQKRDDACREYPAQPGTLGVEQLKAPQGQKADEQSEEDVPVVFKEQIVGPLRQAGEDQQPQGVPPDIPRVSAAEEKSCNKVDRSLSKF